MFLQWLASDLFGARFHLVEVFLLADRGEAHAPGPLQYCRKPVATEFKRNETTNHVFPIASGYYRLFPSSNPLSLPKLRQKPPGKRFPSQKYFG